MTVFSLLKLVHVSAALLSIAGFALRGYWALTDNALRRGRISRVLPHLIDTVLLASAIGMLLVWKLSPLELPWVLAKILALLLYIGLGLVVMRFATSRRGQLLAYIAALASATYIVAVALTHSPLGPFA